MLSVEGRVFYRGELRECCVGIEDGKIVAVKKQLKGDKRLNYGDKLILPGGIDLHVHFREPGMTHKEDFSTGSCSAALGGITTIFDMPNDVPPIVTPSAFSEKLNVVGKKANVDFGLYGGVQGTRSLERLVGTTKLLKIYLAESPGGLVLEDESELSEILRICKESEAFVSVHAEDPVRFKNFAATNLKEHDASRPAEAEVSAIQKLIGISKDLNLHIAHVTSGDALKVLSGASFTVEVTPHHLLLDNESPLGPVAKVNPPLRGPRDREDLWRALAQGHIDVIASDHAPHLLEEKDVPFEDSQAGMPGVATTFPLLMKCVKRGQLSLTQLVSALCENPGQLMHLKKGNIDIGYDADLVVFDPRVTDKVRSKKLCSKCAWSAFEGWEATFPLAVLLRGEIVVEDRQLVAERLGRHVFEEGRAHSKE